MQVTIEIPDQIWNEDPTYAEYFKGMQEEVNRMAVSHYKYGRVDDNAKLASVDEVRSGLKRLLMYSTQGFTKDQIDIIWGEDKRKPLNTGNTENLLDANNFFRLEFLFPKHPKAHFKAQTSAQSPGLTFTEEA